MFTRSRFGEDYLTPSSLVKSAVLFALVVWLMGYLYRIETYGPSTRSTLRTVLSLLPCWLALVAFLTHRFALALALMVLATPLWMILWLHAPSMFGASRLASPVSRLSVLAFGAVSILVTAARLLQASRRPAAHHHSSGVTAAPWVGPRSRASAFVERQWIAQLLVEPVLTGGVGLTLWLLFGNGLGAFLFFAALCLFDSAGRRYQQARLNIATVTSGIGRGEVLDSVIENAIKPTTRETRTFVARRVHRPSKGGG